MSLSQAQADAVLAQLDQQSSAALAFVQNTHDTQESGIVHGVLSLVGQDEDSQLDADLGAVKMTITQIQRLHADEADAVADPDGRGAKWLDACRSIPTSLTELKGYTVDSTIDDVLSKTEVATGNEVKHAANAVVEGAAKFAWSALPWWVIAGGGIALLGVGAVAFMQFRGAARAAAAVAG